MEDLSSRSPFRVKNRTPHRLEIMTCAASDLNFCTIPVCLTLQIMFDFDLIYRNLSKYDWVVKASRGQANNKLNNENELCADNIFW